MSDPEEELLQIVEGKFYWPDITYQQSNMSTLQCGIGEPEDLPD